MSPPVSSSSPHAYVWDASALHHPAKAGNLDLLGSFVKGAPEHPWSHYVTDVVAVELARYGLDLPEWTTLVELNTVDLVTSYAAWTSRLAAGSVGLGESSVATWAEARAEIAIVDDDPAKKVMRRSGVRAHGSAWLLSRAVNLGLVDATSVSSFFDASLAAGQWLPFERFGYRSWAIRNGLLSQ